jgi:predicted alpha/beta-hydrolase family hydrolase
MTDAPPPFLTDGPPDSPWRLILAHGAGAPMDSGFMTGIAGLLGTRGIRVLRFEFPYMRRRREEGGKRPPDRAPVLLDAWRAAVAAATEKDGEGIRLAVGGKSMGGRMATLAAAEGMLDPAPAAVVTLGYPFHPPGRPEKLRTEHFDALAAPTLMVQGTRDPFGKAEEVAGYTLPPLARLHWIDDGDHDLKPRKSAGRSVEDALEEAADAVARFLKGL